MKIFNKGFSRYSFVFVEVLGLIVNIIWCFIVILVILYCILILWVFGIYVVYVFI